MDEDIINPRLIVFYLPQFHPIPENDKWWGKGFTEWTNVVKAKPLFKGHYQPHLPADLGFYDLRIPEVRQAQADLAREYGIYGFCYYHYWFNGKRMLERPFNDVLVSGKPNFPFCLCWANESWTRAWDGRSREILIEQQYSEDDDRCHIRWLSQIFQDKRYIKIMGKPVFLVYRASKLPNPLKTTSIWREEADKMGIGNLYLCRVESFPDEHGDPAKIGFDATVEFQPDWKNLQNPYLKGKFRRIVSNFKSLTDNFKGYRKYDYASIVQNMKQRKEPIYKRFPCVMPSWDNSARRNKEATIIHGSTPELFGKWLRWAIESTMQTSSDDNIIFINAWNEWAEGNHLEPCKKWKTAYLKETCRVLKRYSKKRM